MWTGFPQEIKAVLHFSLLSREHPLMGSLRDCVQGPKRPTTCAMSKTEGWDGVTRAERVEPLTLASSVLHREAQGQIHPLRRTAVLDRLLSTREQQLSTLDPDAVLIESDGPSLEAALWPRQGWIPALSRMRCGAMPGTSHASTGHPGRMGGNRSGASAPGETAASSRVCHAVHSRRVGEVISDNGAWPNMGLLSFREEGPSGGDE